MASFFPPCDCNVCLSEIAFADRFFTQCGHVFHRDCVLSWLTSTMQCPTCRAAQVPLKGEQPDSPRAPPSSPVARRLPPAGRQFCAGIVTSRNATLFRDVNGQRLCAYVAKPGANFCATHARLH